MLLSVVRGVIGPARVATAIVIIIIVIIGISISIGVGIAIIVFFKFLSARPIPFIIHIRIIFPTHLATQRYPRRCRLNNLPTKHLLLHRNLYRLSIILIKIPSPHIVIILQSRLQMRYTLVIRVRNERFQNHFAVVISLSTMVDISNTSERVLLRTEGTQSNNVTRGFAVERERGYLVVVGAGVVEVSGVVVAEVGIIVGVRVEVGVRVVGVGVAEWRSVVVVVVRGNNVAKRRLHSVIIRIRIRILISIRIAKKRRSVGIAERRLTVINNIPKR